MLEHTKWNNGPHLLEFEPPDVLHVHVLAPVTPSEGLESIRIINQEVAANVGEFFLLVHVAAGAGALSTETRKAISKLQPSWKAAVIVGGTPISRAVLNMTLRALSLLSGKQPPTKMVSKLEEGEAFLNEMRGAKAGKASNG